LFSLHYHPKVRKEDIPRLDRPTRNRIRRAIEAKLLTHPEDFAKPLAHTRTGLWSLRVGPWRIIFALRGDAVWILKIGSRREVYGDLDRRLPE
jgi:mRNA interferase RelE/StbE